MSTNSTYVHSTKISTKLSTTSLAFNVKKITRVLVSAILAVTGLFSAASHAQIQPMETVTVIYRTPFDYALYQQTTEMLTGFNRELGQKIIAQARQDNVTLAKRYGFFADDEQEFVNLAAEFTHSSRLHADLNQKVMLQTRLDNLAMAEDFGFFANQSNELAQQDKYPEKIGVFAISE